ncbi:MAG: ABC transporter permease [Bacteroidales bacterium]|nr:ABC transporter permease [Bacteroidales bacterium]
MTKSTTMFRKNLQIAFHIMIRQKGYSLINIFGLAVGLASCIFILLWIQDELSFDKFHEKADRICLVGLDAKLGNQEFKGGASPPPMADALREGFTGIESAARLYKTPDRLVKYENRIFTEDNFYYTDSTFFHIFSFPLLQGDPESALDEPYSVVITREMKEKYFGDREALGEVLRIGGSQDYQITGICENVSRQSHFRFDFLTPFSSLTETDHFNWGSNFVGTYVLLHEKSSAEEINRQFPKLLEKHFGPIIQAAMNISLQEFYEAGNRYSYFLEPLVDIHLRSSMTMKPEGSSDIIYVYVLSLIALFILIIACINFINLSTARSALRAKEVGIKKVLGSGRRQLISQFLVESVILCFISMLVAILLVELLLPSFNQLTEKNLDLGLLSNPLILPALILLSLFTGFAAGSYAAFFQSSVDIISVLKGAFSHKMRSGLIRNLLVFFQFSISIALIICTLTVINQIRFVQNMDTGFDKEQIIVIERFDVLGSQQLVYKEEALRYSEILAASITENVPGGDFSGNGILVDGSKSTDIHILNRFYADYDLPETLGISMAEGRFFSKENATDSTAIIVNQEAVRSMDLADPLNKYLLEPSVHEVKKPVIGIVKDFNFQSAHKPIQPMAIELRENSDPGQFLVLRIQAENKQEIISRLSILWDKLSTDQPFEYFFLDEEFDRAYRQETKLRSVYLIFSILAILIACLGLYGLASFTTERKTKNIGIRKAMGASTKGIIARLSLEFNKWVLISNLIAWPAAYFLMKNWLENFAFRISLGLWPFLLAALFALMIASLTVLYQAYRASLKNPIESLRFE